MTSTLIRRNRLTLAALALATGIAWSDTLDCDAYSGWLQLPEHCESATNYQTGIDACRAALTAVRIAVLAPTGYKCADTGCDEGSCHTAVYYEDATLLTIGPAHLNPATGLYDCKVCWNGGDAKVYCTPCDPL